MKYTMRPKRLAVVGTAAVCLLLGLTACSQKPETAALQNDDALLTVDGCAVTEEEYLLFLRDQKAVTANYYWTQYRMQPERDRQDRYRDRGSDLRLFYSDAAGAEFCV